MARQQPELGTKSPYRLRLGQNIDRFRGVNREADPGAIRDDQLQDAVNIRLTPSGKIIPRGGQAKVNSSAMVGCVDGLIDDETGGRAGGTLYGDSGGDVVTFSYTQTPTRQEVGTAGIGDPIAVHQGRAWYRTSVGHFFSIRPAGDGTVPTPVSEFFVAGTTGWAGRGLSIDGKLYSLRFDDVANMVYLYEWNGSSVSIVDSVASAEAGGSQVLYSIAPVVTDIVGPYELYYCTAAVVIPGSAVDTLTVRRRSSSGTFSTVASRTLTVGSFGLSGIVDYKGRVYGRSSYNDGVGLTTSGVHDVTNLETFAHEFTTTLVGGLDVSELFVFNDYLYTFWADPGLPNQDYNLARFDGTTWDDLHAAAPFGVGDVPVFADIGDGSLYVIGADQKLYKSDGADTTSWSVVLDPFTTSVFGCVALVVP